MLLVIVSAWVSVQLGSIASGWQVVLQIGAGTGAVYILRWYWWRINAWSEISAMACSLLVTVVLNRWQPFTGNSSLVFAKGALATTIVTSIVWLTVTLLTKPEPDPVLLRFYRMCGPTFAAGSALPAQAPEIAAYRDIGSNLGAWALGCAMVYMCLFGTGKILLHQPATGILLLVGSAICAVLLYRGVVQNFKVESQESSSVPDWIETSATPCTSRSVLANKASSDASAEPQGLLHVPNGPAVAEVLDC